jgi:ribonucleoside-diphosphate reductase alpha chain
MTELLTENALRVLEARYLRRDATGQIVETPKDLFHRVTQAVAGAETQFANASIAGRYAEEFYELLSSLEFLPNSPTLMNAGTGLGLLSACFVLPVEDSMPEIFDSLKLMALIQQAGGDTGFSFSHLRPKGDLVQSSGGTASGPVSFMRIFDCATENIRQGANAAVRIWGCCGSIIRMCGNSLAPNSTVKAFGNFNLSVGVSDQFMQYELARCDPEACKL